MPIAEEDSREGPFEVLYRQAGFDEFVVVYILSGIIVDEIECAHLEIDKKRAEHQEQTNPYCGANIKNIFIVSISHRPICHLFFLFRIKPCLGYFEH